MLLILLALFTVGSTFIFARRYSREVAHSFAEDFRKQNYVELARGDIFSLSQRLNSLSSSIHWRCIRADKQGTIFYQRSIGSCSGGLFSYPIRVGDKNSSVEISFTITIAPTVQWIIISFLLFQLGAAGSLYSFAIKLERERSAKLAAVAALADQVAHDIRSPLTVLKTVSIEREVDGNLFEMLSAVTKRIEDILRDLGRHALTADGHTQMRIEAMDLEPLLKSVVAEKAKETSEADRIVLERVSHLIRVSADEALLRRVLSNILNNAIHALPITGGRIEVRTSLRSGTAIVSIEDNGGGIPTHILSQLGGRGVTFGKADGSGLGLFHAKGAMKRMGGDLIIRSSEKGTTVVLELIIAKDP
jgi:signal transduction histidine kinase